MTLKEKFSDVQEAYHDRSDDCVLVADEFAIGFTEWFADNTLRVDLDGYKTFGDTDETAPHTVRELLEIYKKEKGL
jgi:hypothetical protein